MLPALVAEFIRQQRLTDISCVQQEQVKAFYDYLPTRPLQKRSGALSEMMITHYVYALRTFFTWLQVTEQADYNPISGIKFRPGKQNARQPLDATEIYQLFEAGTTLKQTAILHIFYSGGLRRAEGEQLNIADIHFRENLLYVREGKGTKRRVIPLTAKVTADLEAYYLQDRCSAQVKKVKDQEAFFLNRIGNRLLGDQCNRILQQLADKAGLKKEVTLHQLRHSIATHLLQGGMGMEQVRDFLGHYFLESTQVYAKPAAEQLKLL